jgi:hypothetical protein
VKIIVLLLSLFLSVSSIASVLKLEIRFQDPKIKQGAVVPATLVFDAESSQKLPINKIVGETLGGHFYIYSAKPLLTKDNWNAFESEATVIVGKIPEAKPVSYKSGDNEVMVLWNDVEFIPTEAPKELIYGTFEIPSRAKILKWISVLIGIIIVALGILKLKKHLNNKNALQKMRRELKDQVLSAKEYADVVNIWQKKSQILKVFPSLEDHFKELEVVLFKYQFKQSQTESEKSQVMTAYREFINKSQGGFNGI